MGLHVQFSGELTFENTSPIKPMRVQIARGCSKILENQLYGQFA